MSDKIKLTDQSDKLVHKCGCVLEKEENRWFIKEHCETHKPDFQKKADKMMHKRDRKRGRGWTKAPAHKARTFNRAKRKMRQKIM